MLGGTSLAPTRAAPVSGQFDDASPAGDGGTSVTTYDEFGRPRLAGGGGVSGESSKNGSSSASGGRDGGGGEREGRGGDRTSNDKGRDRDRDRCVVRTVCALRARARRRCTCSLHACQILLAVAHAGIEDCTGLDGVPKCDSRRWVMA